MSADFSLRLSPDAQAQPAKLQNISTTGLCCESPEALDEMTKVGIHLELPDQAEPHAIEGVVVRCEKHRDKTPSGYEIAIYFTDLDKASRDAIRQYVLRHLEAHAT